MTREEARDQIVIFMCDEQKVINDRDKQALDMAIKALEQEPYDDAKYHEDHGEVIVDKAVWEDAKRALEQEPKWISVSERLPKEGEDVLACFYTSEGNYKMMVSRRSDYNYWSGVGRTGDMVAWMPLPKPYEPTCDTCEYNTAAFNPCNACKDKSEYKPQEGEKV